MSIISIKQLLEAGVHFGHHTRRWNPKMAPYIFTERNGIYIIDLQKTVKKFEEAYMFVRDLSAEGGTLLFMTGTQEGQGHPLCAVLVEGGSGFVKEKKGFGQSEGGSKQQALPLPARKFGGILFQEAVFQSQ